MEPTLRSTQVLKQEAEDFGLQGKDIAEYVTRQQTLDREERAALRDLQKMQKQTDVELTLVRAEAVEKSRADEIKVKIQIAQIEAANEQAKIVARIEGQAESSQLQSCSHSTTSQ